jgi:hypothetical protein
MRNANLSVRVYNVKDILKADKKLLDDLISAIHEAADVAGHREGLTVKLHEQTKLLIVRGDQEALDVADQVFLVGVPVGGVVPPRDPAKPRLLQ